MRKLVWSCAAVVLMVSGAAAVAQNTSSAPCVRHEPQYGRQKATECHTYYRGQGLRGADLANNTAVCVAEARLTCLQKAAAEHVAVPMRTQFMASCMGA
jgi:hypothetical protein